MRTGVLVPQMGGREPDDFGVHVEDLGYDSVWSPELWGRSGMVHLAAIAGRTDEIDIGSAIVNVFSRSPAVLAMDAASLATISEGRMHLGLGTSTRKVIEDLHGGSFDNPVRYAHETIELVNAFLGDGGTVTYDGDVHHAADFPAIDTDVPVYHAALGKANRRVVARLCDGWIPHNIPWPDLDDAFEYVADHATEAGRDPADIEVAPYVPAAVSEDPAEAAAAIRGHVAYYVGNGEGYRRSVAQRFPEAADEIADAWRSGDRSGAADRVTDEMVAALGVSGTPEEARSELSDLVENTCIDRPLVTVPNNAVEAVGELTIEALAPSAF